MTIEIGEAGEIPDDILREHYERVENEVWEPLGRLEADGEAYDALIVPGTAADGHRNWYRESSSRGRYRPWYPAYDPVADEPFADRWDHRIVHMTINYQSVDPLDYTRRDEDGWVGGSSPTPEYADIRAMALFADVDFDSGEKQRPVDEETREQVEATLDRWAEAYADAVGGDREAVYMLDSVGGTYVFLDPWVVGHVAEWAHDALDREDRERLLDEVASRWRDYNKGIQAEIAAEISIDCFGLDGNTNKNRLYKVPLAVHKRLPGVVTPIGPMDPTFELTHVARVGGEEYDAAAAWATDFAARPDARVNGERATELVKILFPREFVEGTDESRSDEARAVAALEYWVEHGGWDNKNDDDDVAAEQSDGTTVPVVPLTTDENEPWDYIDRIDCEDVAKHLGIIDDVPSDDATRIEVNWRDSKSGNSAIVRPANFDDLQDDSGGGAANLVAWTTFGSSNSKPEKWRRDGERVRFVLNWFRRHGYEVPVVVPSEDVSPYYRMLWRAAADRGIATGAADPETMLEMCLEVRDELDDAGVLEDATPPYKALVGVAEHHDLPMDDADEGILGEKTRETARKIFDAMTVEDVLDEQDADEGGDSA